LFLSSRALGFDWDSEQVARWHATVARKQEKAIRFSLEDKLLPVGMGMTAALLLSSVAMEYCLS
jgi:hypothetical protein